MTFRSARRLAFSAAFALALSSVAIAQEAKAPVVQPAVDGVMEAFKTRPLFGLASTHNVAQEQDLWLSIVRDPRFAREVGNVVVEGVSAAHQDIVDRYVNGEEVPYVELRKLWLDTAAQIPAGISDTGNPYLFATVRELNAALPADQRIRVWLGEPGTAAAANSLGRDGHAADLIIRNILDKKKKALVIYGAGHFTRGGGMGDGIPSAVETKYPDAFFIAATYTRLANPACAELFERAEWPVPALITSIVGTPLEALLTGPDCRPPPGVVVVLGRGDTPELRAERLQRQAAMNKSIDEVFLGGLLYVGPSASLVRSARMPEAFIDPDYRQELARRGMPQPRVPAALAPRRFVPASEDQRIAAFKASDRDGDGKLDKASYREVLQTLGFADQLDTLFAQRDVNKDGFVSADEFSVPIPQ